MKDLNNIRADFPVLQQFRNGKPLTYLDSGASALKPRSVIDKMDEYYKEYGVNIFRGVYSLSERATAEYEKVRSLIASFIGCSDEKEIIFTRNATESANLVAASWGMTNLGEGENIVSTVMEHHANIVPWQIITGQKNVELRYIDINEEGFLLLDNLEKIIDRKTRLVAVTFVSNVLGTINPVKEISKTVKKINPQALVLVDAAQAAPHMKLDVSGIGADFVLFSGHKMLGPTGIGVLWGRFELLEAMPPYQTGGDMIREVYLDHAIFNEAPHRFEAGTPNIAGTIGLGEAVRYLDSIGMEKVRQHELEITKYALEKLSLIEGLEIYGPPDSKNRGGVIAFNVKGIHPHDMAQLLDRENICIRSGHHCAMPLHQRLNIPASCRASFYIYNSAGDVDLLVEGIKKAQKFLKF